MFGVDCTVTVLEITTSENGNDKLVSVLFLCIRKKGELVPSHYGRYDVCYTTDHGERVQVWESDGAVRHCVGFRLRGVTQKGEGEWTWSRSARDLPDDNSSGPRRKKRRRDDGGKWQRLIVRSNENKLLARIFYTRSCTWIAAIKV